MWQKAKVLASGRVSVDVGGLSWVRFLSASFKSHDTVDYGFVGRGIQVIFGGIQV